MDFPDPDDRVSRRPLTVMLTLKKPTSALLLLTLVLGLGACADQNAGGAAPGGGNPAGPPPGNPAAASQTVNLEMNGFAADGYLNANRKLKVPAGFGVQVYARVEKARFLAVAPNGDVLVSQPSTGSIVRVLGGGKTNVFAGGMNEPHDMVFKTFGGTTYLYVSEADKVTRSIYQNGQEVRGDAQVIVGNLPNEESSNQLRGAYQHALKNIAVDDAGKLYISIASASNADPMMDPRASQPAGVAPERAAIYVYDANKTNQDASTGTRFARGIRNAEGLAFAPGTQNLWIVGMGRDNVLNPDGQLVQSYVDNNPPEIVAQVKQGADYGWPFCNPTPVPGMNNLPATPDYENNRDGSKLDCAAVTRVEKGMQGHSAPLGLTFWTNGPAEYKNIMTVAQHGCWNCSKFFGYKVVFFTLGTGNAPSDEKELVSGWITDPNANKPGEGTCANYQNACWGRPVDMADMPDGSLLISDDLSGTVYRLYKK